MAKKRKQKSAKGFANSIKEDLTIQITSQYNQLIKESIRDLALKNYNGLPVSPVLTGFFASSWKADIKPIDAFEERKEVSPWSKMKTVTIGTRGNSRTVLDSRFKAIRKVRHKPAMRFKLADTVFIGNTAIYAEYALNHPQRGQWFNVINWALSPNGLSDRIDKIFTDKNKSNLRMTLEDGSYQQL